LDGANRTTDHTQWITALTASGWYEEPAKTRSIEEQPRVAILMRPDAGSNAITTARAAVQIDQQEFLSLDQSFITKLGGAEQGRVGPRRLRTASDVFALVPS
jgi:hypothetical protein